MIRSTASRAGHDLGVFEIKTDTTHLHLIVRHPAPTPLGSGQEPLDISNNKIDSAQTISAPIRSLNKPQVGIFQRQAQATVSVLLEGNAGDVCPALGH